MPTQTPILQKWCTTHAWTLKASSDQSRVLLFAEATSLSLQLRIVPDRVACFVVAHYYPTWPTLSIRAETGSEVIPFGVDGTGTFVAELPPTWAAARRV